MGIEWIVFGAVWLAMAGFAYRCFVLASSRVGRAAYISVICILTAPFLFGVAVHRTLE